MSEYYRIRNNAFVTKLKLPKPAGAKDASTPISAVHYRLHFDAGVQLVDTVAASATALKPRKTIQLGCVLYAETPQRNLSMSGPSIVEKGAWVTSVELDSQHPCAESIIAAEASALVFAMHTARAHLPEHHENVENGISPSLGENITPKLSQLELVGDNLPLIRAVNEELERRTDASRDGATMPMESSRVPVPLMQAVLQETFQLQLKGYDTSISWQRRTNPGMMRVDALVHGQWSSQRTDGWRGGQKVDLGERMRELLAAMGNSND